MKDKQKFRLPTVPIFLPISKFIIIWYLCVIASIILDFYLTIFYLCFNSYSEKKMNRTVIQWILIIVFFIDIFVSLNTSYIQNGTIVDDPKSVRLRYIKSTLFFLDLISLTGVICQLTIPFNIVYVDFVSLLKIIKIFQFNKLLSKYAIRSSILKLVYQITKQFVLLLSICHVIGSFFFYLDMLLIDAGWYGSDMLWVYSSYAHTNIIELSLSEQYYYSFYYAVVTLSGVAYGDLTPLNPTETLFTLFSLLIPLTIYAFLFSRVLQMIKQQRIKKNQAKKYKKIVINYLKQSGVQQTQYGKFVNFLFYKFEQKNITNNKYLQQINPSLKQQFIRDAFYTSFNFDIFKPLQNPSVKQQKIKQIIATIGQQQSCPAKQTLNLQKYKNSKLYFIISGTVSQYVLIKQQKFNKIINANQFLFSYTFFTGISHSHTNHLVQTNQYSSFLTISLAKFQAKIKNILPVLESYHCFKNNLIFGSRTTKQINHSCFFCQEQDHIIDKCQKLRYPVNYLQSLSKRNQRNIHYKRRNFRISKYNNHNLLNVVSVYSMSLFKKDQKIQYQQKCTQVSEKQIIQLGRIVSLKLIDVVENWKIFQPQFSLR